MIIIENGCRDAAFNLAAEEILLRTCRDDDLFMLWVNDPAVVIGKFQNPFEEVSLTALRRANVPLYRRISGGGTVYHDRGNLNMTVLTDPGPDGPDYERFLRPVAEVLRTLGAPAEIRDGSSLFVGDKKVSGSAETVVSGRLLYHGTLLWDADLDRLTALTGHAREKIVSRSVKSRPSPVSNLKPLLPSGCTEAGLAEAVTKALAPGGAVRSLTEGETNAAETLAKGKYRSWEWNYGQSPSFTLTAGGDTLRVDRGVVTGGTRPELFRHPFTPEEVASVLGDDMVSLYFD